MAVVTATRTLRSEINVPPGRPIPVIVELGRASAFTKRVLTERGDDVTHLAKAAPWTLTENAPRPRQSATAVVADVEIFLPLEGLIDFDKEKERLLKELTSLEADMKHLNERLVNPDFIARAPAEKVQDIRDRLIERTTQKEHLTQHLKSLE